MNVSGRCMVARQESSALLGCRKKVFENARQMWFLVAAHLSSCHGGCGHDDAPWSAACRCITKDFLMEGKELDNEIHFFLACGSAVQIWLCNENFETGPKMERISLCDELTATFDPTMRFKRSNSNLENFHGVFGDAAFSLLLAPWRDIS